MKVWCIDPQSGGVKIPPNSYAMIVLQAEAYAKTCPWYDDFQLNLRFKNQFCYLDASEGGGEPFPIGRLRYFGPNSWTLAFYTYSNERYSPCLMLSGEWYGTLEEGIEACETYLL